MIIWGSKARTFTERQGNFYCPECGDYKDYKFIKVKKYFTLYFIPLFPTSDLGEYVECSECKSTFKESVLEHDPEEKEKTIRGLYWTACMNIMISIALADGEPKDSEIEKIIDTFENIGEARLEKDTLLGLIRVVREGKSSVSDMAAAVAPYLNDQGKEVILRGAIGISKADGIVQAEELSLLHSLSDDLLLPKSYANGIFSEENIQLK